MQEIFPQLSGELLSALIFDLAVVWGTRIIKVLVILFLARFALRFGNSMICRLFDTNGQSALLPENKAKTISVLLTSIWRYFVYAFTIILVLTELDIFDIGPILAGAGIFGFAIGFGAQNLVRDIISGFFIILEDQFSVGDFITTGSYTGVVEELGLRITKIRDFSGELHIIPNGHIEVVTNKGRGSMRALVDVGVAYEEKIDHVISILEDVCVQFAENEPNVVEGPIVQGVVGLDDSAVVIRLSARTNSMTQWQVERDLRRLIKNTFDEKGIEIPYPRRVIYNRGNDKGAELDG